MTSRGPCLSLFSLLALCLAAGCGQTPPPLVEDDVPGAEDAGFDSGAVPDGRVDSGAADRPAADDVSTCPIARALRLPMDTVTGTLQGTSLNASLTCARNTAGAEQFYSLRVASRTGVVITTRADFDTALALRRQCDIVTSEVACNDNAIEGQRNAALRAVLDPGDYVLVVDQPGMGTGGSYTLTVQAAQFADNALCMASTNLSDGVLLTAQDLGRGIVTQPGCFSFLTGPQLYYRAQVAPGDTLAVTVTPSQGSPQFVPALRFLPNCSSVRCITQAVGSTSGATASWFNWGDVAQEVTVAVAGARGEVGRFDIHAAMGRGLRNTSCSRAFPVADGGRFTGLVFTGATETPGICPGSMMPAGGPAVFFRASVPPGNALTAFAVAYTTTGTATTSPLLRVMTACGDTGCLSDSGRAVTGGNSLRWVNGGMSPREVIVAVQPNPVTATATPFDVGFQVRPPPGSAPCAMAPEVMNAGMVRGLNTGDGVDTAPNCQGTTGAVALFHRVTIPPGQMLVATGTRSGGATGNYLAAYDRCGGACLALSSLGNASSPATLRVANNGTAPQQVVVAGFGDSPGATVTYDLAVTLRAAPPNGACTSATALTNGAMLTAQPVTDGTSAPRVCMVSTTGTGLWYRATVPPRQQLVVNLTRTGTLATSLAIQVYGGTCASPTCLTNSPYTTTTTSARWRNPATTPQEVLVNVHTSSTITTGTVTFDLAAVIEPAPYIATMVPASCDNMSAATAVTGVTSVSQSTAFLALPFAFQYFGEAITHTTMAGGGYLQLWTMGVGAPTSNASNVALPAPTAPSRLVAPFWDSLTYGVAASLRTREVLTPARHFTLHWDQVTALGSGTVSFQVKLFADNAIEFHYCTLDPLTNVYVTGQGATVGLQDATGVRSVQHSYNTTGAFGTTSALRFAPPN